MFAPKPVPESPLGRYRVLSPTCSIRVSPLCLGAMSIGTAWENFLGSSSKEESMKILDFFYEQGGNFIDTANNYQEGESEMWIGEWMKKRGNRSEIVLATKFTSAPKNGGSGIKVNTTGNSIKSLHHSVNDSLQKLQTDYIDLLYVHWWDYTTSIPELMQSLDTLVKQGKVLALGISDTPAWLVSKANEYARGHGLRQFSVYQGRYNAVVRDLEREVFPMCSQGNNGEGMGMCLWDTLGGGRFKTAEQRSAMEQAGDKGRNNPRRPVTEKEQKVADVLYSISKELNSTLTGVALAYAIHKAPYVFPIVGGRKVEHLKDNINALNLKLTDEHIKRIEETAPFDIGFPHDFLGGTSAGNNWLLKSVAYMDHVEAPKAIQI